MVATPPRRPPLTFDAVEQYGARAEYHSIPAPEVVSFSDREKVTIQDEEARPASDGVAGGRGDAINRAIKSVFKTFGELRDGLPNASIRFVDDDRTRPQLYSMPSLESGPITAYNLYDERDIAPRLFGQRDPFDYPIRSVRKEIMNTWVQPMVWTRPRCPNKHTVGRKGTRKDWKRKNPPGLRAEGPRVLRRFVAMHQGALFLDDATYADLTKGMRSRRAIGIEEAHDRGLILVKITWRKQRPVERLHEGVGARRLYGTLEMESFDEIETIYCQDQAQVDALYKLYEEERLNR